MYDLRTNMHFTLKTKPLKRANLDEFVECFHPENRHERQENLGRGYPTLPKSTPAEGSSSGSS